MVVGLACLIVGAGASAVVVGHDGHDARRGPGDFRQFPGQPGGTAGGQNGGPGAAQGSAGQGSSDQSGTGQTG